MAGLQEWCGTQDSPWKGAGAWIIPGYLCPGSSQAGPLQEACSTTSLQTAQALQADRPEPQPHPSSLVTQDK